MLGNLSRNMRWRNPRKKYSSGRATAIRCKNNIMGIHMRFRGIRCSSPASTGKDSSGVDSRHLVVPGFWMVISFVDAEGNE